MNRIKLIRIRKNYHLFYYNLLINEKTAWNLVPDKISIYLSIHPNTAIINKAINIESRPDII